jgi:chromosome segregation ATPase
MTAETVNYFLGSVLKEIKDSIKSVARKLDTFQKDVDQKLDNLAQSFDQKLDNLAQSFDQKLETLQKNVEQKLETLQKNVTDVKIGLATLTEKVDSIDNRLIKVEGTQSNQIWTLITLLSGSLIAVGFRAFFMGNNP